MTFALAIAICANLHQEEERAKFSEEQILQAINTILNANPKDVCKPALLNACTYLLEKAQAT